MAASVLSMGPLTIGSTTIACRMTSMETAIADSLMMHSGLPYPTLQVIPGANPRITFDCYFQDIYALTGMTILSATTLDLYMALYSSFTRGGAGVHTKLALASSCTAAVQILSVRTDQDGVLVASCEAVLLSNDGTTHPTAITSSNNLPALTAAPIFHTLGPCVINGSGIPGVMSAALALNPTLEVKRSDGDLYPRVAAQLQGQPRLSVGHGDPKGVLSSLGILGANLSSSCIQYFHRYDATTGVTSASNGVSFTIASGRAMPSSISNEQGKISSTGIEVAGLSSSTTHPVVVSTSASVPASG